MAKQITPQEVAQHNSERSCWLTIHDKVYDVTSFLSEHPGGRKVLLKHAGTDASKQFDAFHSPATLDKYGPRFLVGDLAKPLQEPKPDSGESTETFGDLVPFGDPYWYAGLKSPYYKESHLRLRDAMRVFVDKNITPYCHEWDEAKQLPKMLYTKMAEQNLLTAVVGAPFPKELQNGPAVLGVVDPKEFDYFHWLILYDELSRCGSGGICWGLCGGLAIGLPPVLHFGSEDLKRRVVPQCLSGEKVICLCITEPYAGSDVQALRCEARESEDGQHYIVNGEKKWITNGVFADYFTVAVRTGDAGMGGISMLLIERSMPGVTTRQMKCSGVWSSGTTYITFEDVKVPKANLIGEENKGFKYVMYNFNQERLGIVIQALRFARVCYEDAIKYAHKRKTFGKRLVDHPVIRNKLAHMARKIEATYAWTEVMVNQMNTLPKQEAMVKLGGPIALLKAQATQTFEFCAREAAQIFGGLAYTRGGQGERVERLYREVRAYAIPGGSEEIMLDLGIRQSLKVSQMTGAKL